MAKAAPRFSPAESGIAAGDAFSCADASRFRTGMETQFEAVKIIRTERGNENPANLLVIRGDFQFLSRAPNCKIVDENLALLKRALSDSPQLTKFQVVEMLNTDPDPGSKHSQHQPEGAPGRPQQKEA